MHPLLSFYNEKGYDAIPPYKNDIVLKTVEDVLIVNLDAIYERTYGYRAIDQLIYLICKQEHNKKLIFLSRDGANLSLTGISKLIEKIINFLNLNQDSCVIICREPVSINGATTFVFEAIPMWCAALVEHFQEKQFPGLWHWLQEYLSSCHFHSFAIDSTRLHKVSFQDRQKWLPLPLCNNF
jgi:hypothetical protein